MILLFVRRDLFAPADFFDGARLDLPQGACIADALRAAVDAGKLDAAAEKTASVWRNRMRADRGDTLEDGDTLDVIVRPGVEVSLSAILTSLVISTALSFAFRLLFPPPRPAKERDDDASPTYGFSGITTSRSAGLPIGIGFGEHRVGGQIVQEFTRTTGLPPRTDYYFLISLGEGPIESIGGVTADNPIDQPLSANNPARPLPAGIQINGNPVENFSDVEMHVRLGSSEQAPIPGFEEVVTQDIVDAALLQDETTGTDTSQAVLTDVFGTGADAVWAARGEAFDILDREADAFVALLEFPGGLYIASSSTGALEPQDVRVAFRYIELDLFGSPITTGGANGDGYVRLAPQSTFFSSRSRFQIEYRAEFVDPQTWTPPALGKSLASNGTTSDYAQLSMGGASLPAAWAAGSPFDAITVEGWVKLTTRTVSMPWFVWGPVDSSTATGIQCRFQRVQYSVIGAGGFQNVWRLDTWLGNGTQTYRKTYPSTTLGGLGSLPPGLPEGEWVHVAFTYQANVDTSGRDRVRSYVNGQLWDERIQVINAITPTAVNWRIHADTINGSAMQTDELNVYHQELTASQVQSRYNAGQGRFGTALPTLVAGYHFETGGGPPGPTPDYSGFGNNLTLHGGITAGVVDGHVFTAAGGTRKRSRYRVEVCRINVDSTNANQQDDVRWLALQTILDEQFSYPLTALVGGRIRASEQYNTQRPNVTTLARFYRGLVWDGASETAPNLTSAWTRNPAWNVLAVILDGRVGLGQWHTAADVDLPEFRAWAEWCDEIVYDGRQRLSSDVGQVIDAQYDSTTVDSGGNVRGSILLVFAGTQQIPTHWQVGGFVRLLGWPTPDDDPDVLLDINNDRLEGGGYEIREVTIGLGTRTVRIYWDRLAEGDPWLDGAQLSTRISPDTLVDDYEAVVEGGERRMELDVYMDTERKAWDQLLEIASTARATLVRVGSKIRPVWSAPRPLSGIIGARDIIPGTFRSTWEGPKRRFNVVTIGFQNRDTNYERDEVGPIEDESIVNTASFQEVRTHTFDMQGVTRRSQIVRHARFMLNAQRLIVRRCSLTMNAGAVPFLPGSRVRLAHDLLPRGKSGALSADSADESEVRIDRAVTLEISKTYRVVLRHEGQAIVRTIGAAPGTYAPGDALALISALPFVPTKGAAYVLCADGEELDVEIGRVRLLPDLSVEIDCIEYRPEVYDDRIQVGAGADQPSAPSSGLGIVPPIPLPPGGIKGKLLLGTGGGGGKAATLSASWTHEPRTVGAIQRTEVWVAVGAAPAVRVATLEGPAESIDTRIPWVEDGERVTVSVRAVGRDGGSAADDLVERAELVATADYGAPPALTAASVSWVEDQAVYAWELPEGWPALVVEARRGGWVLGAPVFTSGRGAGSYGPTGDWADGPLVLRTRDDLGRYSEPLVLDVVSPVSRNPASLEVGYQTQQWRAFGDGWVLDSPGMDPTPVLVDLVRDAHGDLRFDGAALTGSWTSPNPLLALSRDIPRVIRPLYVAACVEAVAEPWLTPEGIDLPPGAPELARLTPEGVTHQRRGEVAPCSLRIEARANLTGRGDGWTDWRPYRPGLVRAVAVQFRLLATRTDTSNDLRIVRFATEASQRGATLYDRTPESSYLQREIYG